MRYQKELRARRQDKTGQEKRSSVRSKMNRNLKKSSRILMYTRTAKWNMKVLMKMRKQENKIEWEVQIYNK